MTSHYNIQLIATKTDLKVTYRDNKFRKLEHLRGVLTQDTMDKLGSTIPVSELNFAHFMIKYKGIISYLPIESKPKTLYTQFLEEWNRFYNQYMTMPPKFTGADGNSLKQIISYLVKIAGSDQEALTLWQLLLSKWNTLNKFHQQNTDLKYINSQLNKILQNVKANNSQSNEQVFTRASQSEVGKNFKF